VEAFFLKEKRLALASSAFVVPFWMFKPRVWYFKLNYGTPCIVTLFVFNCT
jgi:hypothetical protein